MSFNSITTTKGINDIPGALSILRKGVCTVAFILLSSGASAKVHDSCLAAGTIGLLPVTAPGARANQLPVGNVFQTGDISHLIQHLPISEQTRLQSAFDEAMIICSENPDDPNNQQKAYNAMALIAKSVIVNNDHYRTYITHISRYKPNPMLLGGQIINSIAFDGIGAGDKYTTPNRILSILPNIDNIEKNKPWWEFACTESTFSTGVTLSTQYEGEKYTIDYYSGTVGSAGHAWLIFTYNGISYLIDPTMRRSKIIEGDKTIYNQNESFVLDGSYYKVKSRDSSIDRLLLTIVSTTFPNTILADISLSLLTTLVGTTSGSTPPAPVPER